VEVRNIDPKSESHHHAGKIVGSPLKTISSNNRTTHKFSESHDHPAPFSYLFIRALEGHNAGRTRTDSRDVIPPSVAPCQSAPSSPAPFSYLRLKTLESPHHAGTTEQKDGNAGNQTVVRLHPIIPSDRVSPTFYFGCPAPSQPVSKKTTVTCYRPSSGPHSIPQTQNADGTARSHFLLSSSRVSPVQNGSARTLPRRPSAPNSSDQNAGHSDGHSPPRLIGLKPKLLSRSPCASHSSNSTEVIGRDAKTLSPFKRFFSYLWSIRLERLKTREMTNFGWRKKT
jgi:hypothetical protein